MGQPFSTFKQSPEKNFTTWTSGDSCQESPLPLSFKSRRLVCATIASKSLEHGQH